MLELAVGKKQQCHLRGRWQLLARHPREDDYVLALRWPINESNDDYESWNCGCPFSGEAHVHTATPLKTLAELFAAYEAAKKALLDRAEPSRVARDFGLKETDGD